MALLQQPPRASEPGAQSSGPIEMTIDAARRDSQGRGELQGSDLVACPAAVLRRLRRHGGEAVVRVDQRQLAAGRGPGDQAVPRPHHRNREVCAAWIADAARLRWVLRGPGRDAVDDSGLLKGEQRLGQLRSRRHLDVDWSRIRPFERHPGEC